MNINAEFIAFFFLSVGAIGGAVFFITLKRVMHMAVALAFCFLSIAGVYLLLHAEFLAVIQVLIYTGAVTILMIYGIMLTKQNEEKEEKNGKYIWDHSAAFIGVGTLFLILLWIIHRFPIIGGSEPKDFQLVDIGVTLFRKYTIPFEIVSILLFVALMGAIILAKKEEKN